MRSRVCSATAAISRKPILRSRKAATAASFAAFMRRRRAAPSPQRLAGHGDRRESVEVRRFEGQLADGGQIQALGGPRQAAGRARRRRRRSGCACPAGPAGPASSRPAYSTRLWITDCGCIRTLDALLRRLEQVGRLDHLQALVHHRRGIDRNLGAHRSSWDGPPPAPAWRLAIGGLVPGAERSARGGQDQARYLVRYNPRCSTWKIAECSESTGITAPPAARATWPAGPGRRRPGFPCWPGR